jgi:putative transposase
MAYAHCAMESTRYPTDLSDEVWLYVRPHLPEPAPQGRPRLHGLRAILDAVFYVLKSGCPWRLLPREFPPWKTVYDRFRRWRIDGTWERLNAQLRERLRCRLGREPNPSAGIVDSQSARTSGVGGQERGFDPAKQVEGRKRHSLLDTEGLVLKAKVHSARIPDADGIGLLLGSARVGLSRLWHLWVDAGYQGRGKRWAEEAMGLSVEVVRKPNKPVPEKEAELWAAEWAKEGKAVDWQKLMPPKGFPSPAPKVGGGADLRVDKPQPEDEQGLRKVVRHRGSLRLCGDDEAYGEEVGPCVGVSRQSLKRGFSEVRGEGEGPVTLHLPMHFCRRRHNPPPTRVHSSQSTRGRSYARGVPVSVLHKLGGDARRSGDGPGAAGDRGGRLPEGGPGLQERLGGRPFRDDDGNVPREPESRAVGGTPREAGVLQGPPRRAVGPRYAGARGPCLTPGAGSPFGPIHSTS